MDQPLTNRSPQWRKLFIKTAGFGTGVTLVAIVTAAVSFWYTTRPGKVRPWNREAITAKYSDLYARTGQPLVFTFRYTIENHTGLDYELPTADNLYKVLSNGKGLERDATLKWDGGTSVPAGQKVNVGIHVEYEHTEDNADLDEKLNAFTRRRLSEIEGFAALDQIKRYEIRFARPPEVK